MEWTNKICFSFFIASTAYSIFTVGCKIGNKMYQFIFVFVFVFSQKMSVKRNAIKNISAV